MDCSGDHIPPLMERGGSTTTRSLSSSLWVKFAKTLEWIVEKTNPRITVKPVLSICADLVLGRLAYRKFLMKKSWILVTLLLFLCSQSIMYQHNRGNKDDTEKIILFALRMMLYGIAMVALIIQHGMKIAKAYQKKATCWRVAFPFVATITKTGR